MNENSEILEKRIGENFPADAPKVSVIVPAYNIAPYIAETLDSVLAQTYKDYEIILINDGSTDADDLQIALAPYFDSLLYVERENGGLAAARNTAIRLARGELVAFLDGDDIWLPSFLASQVEFIEKTDFEMIYCDALIFGDPFFEGRTFMRNAPSNGAVTSVSLLKTECNVIGSGTLIKRETFDKYGFFDEKIRRAQDFDLWFRMARKGAKIGYQREVLLKYRVRPDNLSGGNVDRAERNISIMNIIRDKYDLDERETAAWREMMNLYFAEVELEKGKSCLAQSEYRRARAHFSKANEFYRKPKLTLVQWLLQISPVFAVWIFRKVRPSEFAFVTPKNVGGERVGMKIKQN